MNAVVEWKGRMSFRATSDSGFELNLGAAPEVGGDNDGFRPLELMAISLAGCTAMDVISILAKKRQDVRAFRVNVELERAAEHPKVFTRGVILYRVVGGRVEEDSLRRAIQLSAERYCPAQAMLGKVFPIELRYEIYEEDAGQERLAVQGTWAPA